MDPGNGSAPATGGVTVPAPTRSSSGNNPSPSPSQSPSETPSPLSPPPECGYDSPRDDTTNSPPSFSRARSFRAAWHQGLQVMGHGVTSGTATGTAFTDPNSLTAMLNRVKNMTNRRKVSIKDRICCYQWTWFTMTMATGGVANVLYSSMS